MRLKNPFAKPPPPPVVDDPDLMAAIVAILVCWAAPMLLNLWYKDKAATKFAILELLGCALGNGLIAATPIVASTSEAATLACLWLLFMALYFPAGGHFNSALTVGAWVCGQVTLAMSVVIIFSQTIGSALGVELTRYATDSALHGNYGLVVPSYVESGLAPAVGYEAVCSVLMVLVQLGLFQAVDQFFVVASTLVVVLVKATGAFMDPLGPTSAAVFARDGAHLEIGWIGGLVGGAIAGYVWRNVLGKE